MYAQIVIATLGSQFASTIAPSNRAKNGHEEIKELKAQFYGAAHWDKEVKVQMEFLLNGK